MIFRTHRLLYSGLHEPEAYPANGATVCSELQIFTGSAHASNIIIDPKDFQWLSAEDLVGRFEVAEAKHYATSFCTKCGSSLPWLPKSGKAFIIPAGTLDDTPAIKPRATLIKYHKFCGLLSSADSMTRFI